MVSLEFDLNLPRFRHRLKLKVRLSQNEAMKSSTEKSMISYIHFDLIYPLAILQSYQDFTEQKWRSGLVWLNFMGAALIHNALQQCAN